MVEYSLDIKIPEHVWDHPVLVGLSRAAIDIMTWPNVSISCLLPLSIYAHFFLRIFAPLT